MRLVRICRQMHIPRSLTEAGHLPGGMPGDKWPAVSKRVEIRSLG